VGWWVAEQAGTGRPGAKVRGIIVAHDVFISYAADDKSIADAVCAALEQRQIGCWIAPRDARPGLDYADSIVDALDETSVMVFVLSSKSIASPHVKREVEHAANKGTHVIPFRIEDVQLSRGLRYFLGTVHYIDALTPPIEKYLDYLGETVQYFLDRKRASGTTGEISAAAPGGPASQSMVSPRVPPHDDAPPPPASKRSPSAGIPPAAPMDVSAPAPHVMAPLAPAEAPALPAALPAEPPSPAPVRTISPGVTTRPGTGPSEEVARTGHTISVAPSPAGEPIAGSATEAPRPFGPRVGGVAERLWRQVVGFGTIGATLGGLLGFGILAAIFGPERKLYLFAIGFTFMTVVPAGIVTWGWLYGVRQPALPPAAAGGLGGLLGGALSSALTSSLMPDWPSYVAVSNALQWAAFGAAGGLAVSRGGSARPAVRVGLALVAVFFVRTLYLALQRRRGLEDALPFLLFDLPIAIGWGVGLILCPATTAALRPPQAN
jgi:TIR domain